MSVLSGYLATKLMAMLLALRSQLAWSWRNASKSFITQSTQAWDDGHCSSTDSFIAAKIKQPRFYI